MVRRRGRYRVLSYMIWEATVALVLIFLILIILHLWNIKGLLVLVLDRRPVMLLLLLLLLLHMTTLLLLMLLLEHCMCTQLLLLLLLLLHNLMILKAQLQFQLFLWGIVSRDVNTLHSALLLRLCLRWCLWVWWRRRPRKFGVGRDGEGCGSSRMVWHPHRPRHLLETHMSLLLLLLLSLLLLLLIVEELVLLLLLRVLLLWGRSLLQVLEIRELVHRGSGRRGCECLLLLLLLMMWVMMVLQERRRIARETLHEAVKRPHTLLHQTLQRFVHVQSEIRKPVLVNLDALVQVLLLLLLLLLLTRLHKGVDMGIIGCLGNGARGHALAHIKTHLEISRELGLRERNVLLLRMKVLLSGHSYAIILTDGGSS